MLSVRPSLGYVYCYFQTLLGCNKRTTTVVSSQMNYGREYSPVHPSRRPNTRWGIMSLLTSFRDPWEALRHLTITYLRGGCSPFSGERFIRVMDRTVPCLQFKASIQRFPKSRCIHCDKTPENRSDPKSSRTTDIHVTTGLGF